ncbi:MAG: hypothetical protein Tsb0020_53610 [Haliangiales bacterium]
MGGRMTRPQIENRISLGNLLVFLTLLAGAAAFYFRTEWMQRDLTQQLEVEQANQAGQMQVLRAHTDAQASANAARITSLERAVDGELGHIRRSLDRIIARLDRMDESRRDIPSRNGLTGDPR